MGDMTFFKNHGRRLIGLIRSEDGPTATEYAVMLAVISATVLGAMGAFGTKMGNIYTIVNDVVARVF